MKTKTLSTLSLVAFICDEIAPLLIGSSLNEIKIKSSRHAHVSFLRNNATGHKFCFSIRKTNNHFRIWVSPKHSPCTDLASLKKCYKQNKGRNLDLFEEFT